VYTVTKKKEAQKRRKSSFIKYTTPTQYITDIKNNNDAEYASVKQVYYAAHQEIE
jgi:hypothetical protein